MWVARRESIWYVWPNWTHPSHLCPYVTCPTNSHHSRSAYSSVHDNRVSRLVPGIVPVLSEHQQSMSEETWADWYVGQTSCFSSSSILLHHSIRSCHMYGAVGLKSSSCCTPKIGNGNELDSRPFDTRSEHNSSPFGIPCIGSLNFTDTAQLVWPDGQQPGERIQRVHAVRPYVSN